MGAIVGGSSPGAFRPTRLQRSAREEFVLRNRLQRLHAAHGRARSPDEGRGDAEKNVRRSEENPGDPPAQLLVCQHGHGLRGPCRSPLGPVLEAAGASACLPGLLPCIRRASSDLLVDGGVLNNLPVAELAARGRARDRDLRDGRDEPRSMTACRSRARALRAKVRREITGEAATLLDMVETLTRMIALGSVDTSEEGRLHADVVIEPGVRASGSQRSIKPIGSSRPVGLRRRPGSTRSRSSSSGPSQRSRPPPPLRDEPHPDGWKTASGIAS